MKKFMIVLIVVAIAISVVGKLEASRKEESLRVAERQALQAEIEGGFAPLAWTCKTFGMTLVVNDDGQPVCSGVAQWNGREVVAENVAAFHLAQSCEAAGGVASLATVQAGAPKLSVRCVNTRFSERWVAANK